MCAGFLQVFYPYVLAYLVLYFFQGAPGITQGTTCTFLSQYFRRKIHYGVLHSCRPAGGSGGSAVGLLSNARQYLWIPITQNAYRRISLDLFSHMLDLDLHFHLHRKTGEVMRCGKPTTGPSARRALCTNSPLR